MVKVAYDKIYAHQLPAGHRFPMLKYELIPGQLLHEGTINDDNIFSPQPSSMEVLSWTHDKEYLDKLFNQSLSASEQRKLGFPQSLELLLRERVIVQGTIDCCKYAMQYGVALNVAGGTHHAFANSGEGFCLLNDFAVAANYLLKKELAAKILIIDLDVHQGNGTAKLFEDESRVFTFSMHGRHNYPFKKEKGDLDLPLEDGTNDEAYLSALSEVLPDLLECVNPDVAFYLSGVDILSTDNYGKLCVSIEGCKKRDAIVFSHLKDKNIPVVVSMGGGYSPDIKTIAEAHCNTFRTAIKFYE